MNDNDFDQSDAEILAEFAGFEHDSRHIYIMPENLMDFHVEDNPYFPKEEWKPWSLEVPQWQIQSCLDAVREKGLEYQFIQNLWDELKTSHLDPHTGANKTERGMLVAEAPPEAICSAILSMEVN